MIKINDPDDPRIAAYRDVRERDLVGRQDRFVAEGKVVLEILLRSARFETESVFVLEKRLPLVAEPLVSRPDVPVFIADSDVMDRIAGFAVHRGILAIGRRNALPAAEELAASLPSPATLVVSVGISNHDNIGSIFRNAAASAPARC